jgi:hypothetical protein
VVAGSLAPANPVTGCSEYGSALWTIPLGRDQRSSGRAQILTRRGNNWTDKYPAIANAISGLPARNAYLDSELCGLLSDGRTAFNLIQNATDTGEGSLIFFLFDLLFLDGENLTALPLVDRKTRLASQLNGAPDRLRYNDHQIGQGPAFHRLACEHGVEGIVSKRANGRYQSGMLIEPEKDKSYAVSYLRLCCSGFRGNFFWRLGV